MKFVIYPDKAGLWRWKLKANNGANVANGSEGYASESNCVRALRRVKQSVPSATVQITRKPMGAGNPIG